MQIDRATSRGQLVPLLFIQDALAASQTDVQIPLVEAGASVTAVDAYVMPFAGEIVGISAKLSAAGSAGTLTVGPTVGGTEKTALQLSVTTETEKRSTVRRNTVPIAAGDQIGCEITTDGSWNGTTADLGVIVWVLLYLEGI